MGCQVSDIILVKHPKHIPKIYRVIIFIRHIKKVLTATAIVLSTWGILYCLTNGRQFCLGYIKIHQLHQNDTLWFRTISDSLRQQTRIIRSQWSIQEGVLPHTTTEADKLS